MKKLVSIACICFLIACNNTAEKTTRESDSTSVEEIEEIAESENKELEQAKVAFQPLFSFFNAGDSSHTTENYEQTMAVLDTAIVVSPINKNNLEPFRPLMAYNTDSSLAIDLFSYSYIPQKTQSGYKLQGGEPDAELALIDFKTGTRKRLLFLGPSYGLVEAKFVNNQVYVSGYETLEPGKIRPIIWQFDLQQKEVQRMAYTDTLRADIRAYLNKRYTGYSFD